VSLPRIYVSANEQSKVKFSVLDSKIRFANIEKDKFMKTGTIGSHLKYSIPMKKPKNFASSLPSSPLG
tara:strand:+ start:8 stop:211 length:204 start_codon:yes stop_codon:yes gene_type:complete